MDPINTNQATIEQSPHMFAPGTYPGIEGRVALITGAGGGIGCAMALAFARHGAKLVLLDIDEPGLARTNTMVASEFPKVEMEMITASVSDPRAIQAAIDTAHTRCGSIDILLNNAGIALNKPSIDLTSQEWQEVMDINLSGCWYTSQAVGTQMIRQRHGCIVNVASIWGLASAARRLTYCVSKAGLISMTKVLATEWADMGIRVNALCPGYTATPLVAALVHQGRVSEEALMKRTPLRRLGQPNEIADAALYLASDSAAFITGHTLVSDGGWLADGS